MKDIILLRPHHALCSQFFIGNGYSEKFVENMTEILNILNIKNPKVKFVKHCDDICSQCPKNQNGICVNESKVQNIDNACINEYNFNIGDELFWNDIKSTVTKQIILKNQLPSVCNDCQWLSICQNIKFKKFKNIIHY